MRVAAIDQGTTSTRALVIDADGNWEIAASHRHGQHHPQPGWVEHDAEELIRNIRTCLTAAGDIDAIGLANQGESCLAWDAETKAPLSPVIVWQDARTHGSLSARPAADAQRSKAICGLPLDPYFSASKLAWLRQNMPSVRAAEAKGTLRLGTTDAFFLDRLAGVFATDCATASRTGLMDLATQEWSAELCALHGVPIECLPPIRAVDAGFGAIGGVPVRASIVDQQAALYGHNARRPGDCKITFGTGAFLLALTGSEPPTVEGLLPTLAWKRQGQPALFAVEGGVYDAGSALEWARRIGLFSTLDELGSFHGPSAISRGLVFVPALSGLAAPHWDRLAAPLFIGMDHTTDRRDMVRAVLEGIALLTVGLIEEASCAVSLGPTISIDGGVSQSAYFTQFLASAAGRAISVAPMHELTALGLAELCGQDVSRARMGGQTFTPAASVSGADLRTFATAVARAREWRS
ncbi:FGGY family carbohydrate kinase [Pseudotabrizicola alkalilacus]|uniref:ATP:glycerol 3-phosphotransferase n=1 Tax=Pseudotabrizicola alkalilacus TaxID=2305252 RepID=A0A411YWZ4_9RHOB|nr:FGGY family carbohydrate kinase [Pseudotabrizicola alkalilacus]RGP35300.1 glycerol kinase [Pseudotabrizicola alkalilacus]